MKYIFKITLCASSAFFLLCLASCDSALKTDYAERNSPTTGQLKIFYDEGLALHVKNQALTFESHYADAHLSLFPCAESEAVQALYDDSCEAIVISRPLSASERKAFETKDYFPKFSAVAKSAVALITNTGTSIRKLTYDEVIKLLTQPFEIKDSTGNTIKLTVIFDKNNSSVIHYLKDSLLKGKDFSSSCNILNSSLESINYVAQNKNTIAFIDFAWLSDVDDSIYKTTKNKIKFIAVDRHDSVFTYPDQSSFKLGTYPFTRTVYVYRKTGDFTLAKGFESFVAGPKGQLTFLKQGLLPNRQSERKIEINTEPLKNE
ncbi:MAG TPA: substrate-binding domain-containing protein [Bacteroidia bacterium]|nr:substrate-binding domain-containing protein [Bacteroidia bacterium]